MKKTLTIVCIIATVSAFGQSILEATDNMILSGDYQRAYDLIHEKTPGNSVEDTYLFRNKEVELLIKLGRLSEAESLLDLLDKENVSTKQRHIATTNRSFLLINQGRYDRAIELLSEIISKLAASKEVNSLPGAQAITYYGHALKYTGRDHEAIEQLQMALRIRREIAAENKELIAASLNDLGLAYAGFDNNKALDYYEEALALYKQLHGNDHPKIAIANINTGFIYKSLELYGDAVNNFESALAIWEKIHPNAHPTKAFALLNLGDTYQTMGNNSAAQGYYERSLELYRKSYGEKHPELADVLNKLGNLEVSFGKFDQGLTYLQSAVIANAPKFSDKDISKNPQVSDYYNGKVLLYSLLYKAQAFEKRHFGKTLKFSDLENSLQTLQYCDSLIDRLRQETTNESDKLALGALSTELYADAVRVCHELARNSPRKKKFEELAFYFAEKSKSAVLLEAISESNAKSFAGIPPELLEEEEQLRADIAIVAQQLASKPDEEAEAKLRGRAFELNREYKAFIQKLEDRFPKYFDLKFNTTAPSLQDLQKSLKTNTAIISYFIDEREKRIYLFTITKNSLKITDKLLPADFDKQITGLRNGILYNEINVFKRSSFQLGKLLLPALPNNISKLIILPTARLSTIPFEVLLTDKVKESEETFNSLPYLIKAYDVRYEFSTALLLQKQKGKDDFRPPSILLCAPVNFADANLDNLPGTESEVAEISSLFQKKNFFASAKVNDEATESFIKNVSDENFSMLHFATHGVVDESNPELSRIFLNSFEKDDGNLYASEIYNLKLNVNLVTLSACQTGLGKISKGEGVIGLSRALVYAGAKNIIVSFWSVSDESTSMLMTKFYEKLLNENSSDYSASLQNAKLQLIESDTYAAPYYWAPFVLIGY